MATVKWVALFLVISLTGCSAMPVSQTLGEHRHEHGGWIEWNKDNGNERLVSAFILRELPSINGAIGFEVEFPEELKQKALVGIEKEFLTFKGEVIHLTRKAFQGDSPETGNISVAVFDGKGYTFASRDIHSVTLYSPDGKPFLIQKLRKLSSEEIGGLYERIQQEFPDTSSPIKGSGTRYLSGRDAELALRVPPTATLEERGAIAGLGAVYITDPVNAVLSVGAAAYRTTTLSPMGHTLSSGLPENASTSNEDKFAANNLSGTFGDK